MSILVRGKFWLGFLLCFVGGLIAVSQLVNVIRFLFINGVPESTDSMFRTVYIVTYLFLSVLFLCIGVASLWYGLRFIRAQDKCEQPTTRGTMFR